MNATEFVNWVYAKCLKREGVSIDGETAQVKETDTVRCVKCYQAVTPLYGKKYGVFLNNYFYCEKCRNRIGQCFICRTMFESDKDLSNKHSIEIECKKCKI